MPAALTVEELAINDSFINYCFNANEADTAYWRSYVSDHPLEAGVIEEAKSVVLALRVMLHEQKNEQTGKSRPTGVYKIMLRKFAVAAAVLFMIITAVTFIILSSGRRQNATVKLDSPSAFDAPEKIFITAKGEKKVIELSDSTKIYLNAGSVLKVAGDFGKSERTVFLSGEALFEVIHDEARPFIVQTEKYNVIDLGTVFNVKAYAHEKTSETSLIKGSIEINMKNGSRKIKLSPYQKLIVTADDITTTTASAPQQSAENIMILPVSFSNSRNDSAIVETAWSQNRLEIVNKRFADMKGELERWYNVNIVFADEEIGRYPFTATFEKETIEQALKALQYSYHFTYRIKDSTITISK